MRVRFNADEFCAVPEDVRQSDEIVAPVAPNLEDPTGMNVFEHFLEQWQPPAPVDDVSIGVIVPELTPPLVKLAARRVTSQSASGKAVELHPIKLHLRGVPAEMSCLAI